jgi:hypothetical protein
MVEVWYRLFAHGEGTEVTREESPNSWVGSSFSLNNTDTQIEERNVWKEMCRSQRKGH